MRGELGDIFSRLLIGSRAENIFSAALDNMPYKCMNIPFIYGLSRCHALL